MWINDGERESGGVDVKSVEFAVDCVVRGGAVTESERRTTVFNICHTTLILWTKKRRGRKRREKERRREEQAQERKKE